MQRRKLRRRARRRRRSRRRSCASSRVVRLDRSNAPRSAPPRSPPSFFSSRRCQASSPSVPAPAPPPHPRRRARFRKSSRTRSAAASLALTLGERKSANAHLSLASSFSAVSTPANGAGCRVKSARALAQPRHPTSPRRRRSEVVHSSRRHGAYGDASSASARAERLSGSEPSCDASGFARATDGVSEGSRASRPPR